MPFLLTFFMNNLQSDHHLCIIYLLRLLFHCYTGSSSKQKYDTNSSYDYVVNQGTLLAVDGQGSAAVYQETVLYHSVGPDVSKPATTATKTSQSRSTSNELASNLYEAPATQKFRVSTLNIYSTHTQWHHSYYPSCPL